MNLTHPPKPRNDYRIGDMLTPILVEKLKTLMAQNLTLRQNLKDYKAMEQDKSRLLNEVENEVYKLRKQIRTRDKEFGIHWANKSHEEAIKNQLNPIAGEGQQASYKKAKLELGDEHNNDKERLKRQYVTLTKERDQLAENLDKCHVALANYAQENEHLTKKVQSLELGLYRKENGIEGGPGQISDLLEVEVDNGGQGGHISLSLVVDGVPVSIPMPDPPQVSLVEEDNDCVVLEGPSPWPSMPFSPIPGGGNADAKATPTPSSSKQVEQEPKPRLIMPRAKKSDLNVEYAKICDFYDTTEREHKKYLKHERKSVFKKPQLVDPDDIDEYLEAQGFLPALDNSKPKEEKPRSSQGQIFYENGQYYYELDTNELGFI